MTASALDRALDLARKAGVLAEASGRTDLIVRARGCEGNVLAMQGDAEAGRALVQEALSLALASTHTEAAAEAYRRLASVLDYSSDFAGARDAYATAVAYCRDQGDDLNARGCLGCMSAILYRTGEWKRALEVSREVAGDPTSPAPSPISHAVTGLVRVHRGEARGARGQLEKAVALAKRSQAVVAEMFGLFGLARVAELEDDVGRAADLHRQLLEHWQRSEDRHDAIPFFLWQSTFFGKLGREPETAERADALARMASGTGNPESVAALAHALGEVSLAAGKPAEAVEQLEEALAQTEKLEIPLELAVTSWRCGVALAAVGKRAEAVRRFTRAYRLARNLGARPLAALVDAELRQLGERLEEGRHPDGKARAQRGGLTRRQVEIVRLLAGGLTNKEIASKLFLSPRTVDMHVSNVFERLDCRSRTEAARKAAELGLVE